MATSMYQETDHQFDENGVYLVSGRIKDAPGIIEIAKSESSSQDDDIEEISTPSIVFIDKIQEIEQNPDFSCAHQPKINLDDITSEEYISSFVNQLTFPSVVLGLPSGTPESVVDTSNLYLSTASSISSLQTEISQDTIPVDSELIPYNLTENIHRYQYMIDTSAFQGIWEEVLGLFEISIQDKVEKYSYLYYELLDLRAIISFNNENLNQYLKLLYQKIIILPDLSWHEKKSLIYQIILKLVSRNNLKFGFASYIALNQILNFWGSDFTIAKYPPKTTMDISYSYLSHTILEKLILQANFENKRYSDLLAETIEWIGKIILALRNYHVIDNHLQKLLVVGIFKLWRNYLLDNYQSPKKESLTEKKYLDMIEVILPSFLHATYELNIN